VAVLINSVSDLEIVVVNNTSIRRLLSVHINDAFLVNIRILKKALIGAFFCSCQLAAAADGRIEKFNLSCLDKPILKPIDAKILTVLDGDTFSIADGRVVQLSGISAPQYNYTEPSYSDNGAQQSRQYLAKLLPQNTPIKLILDHRKQDRYGHILASVSRSSDNLDIVAEMLHSGWARQIVHPPNDQQWQCYQALEQEAQRQHKGLWQNLRYWPRVTKFVDKTDAGYLRLSGEITAVKRSRRYLTLILDNKIWLGVKLTDLANFSEQLEFKYLHQKVDVRGWLYFSHEKLRIRIRHPQQLHLLIKPKF